MKRFFSWVGLYGLTFLISLFSVFFYVFVICLALVNFEIITEKQAITIPSVVAVLLSLMITYWVKKSIGSKRISRFGKWAVCNLPKLILFYLITSALFVSLKPEVVWSLEDLKSTISLEWTILGITVAVFLVWSVVILQYIKSKQPVKPKNDSLWNMDEYITQKGNFYYDASSFFNSVSMLTANLLVLIIATYQAYVLNMISLWSQNLGILSFYFCTNTLLLLLSDILKPLSEEKKEILKNSKVTKKDVDLQNEFRAQLYNTKTAIEEVRKLDSIGDEQKSKIIMELLNKVMPETNNTIVEKKD